MEAIYTDRWSFKELLEDKNTEIIPKKEINALELYAFGNYRDYLRNKPQYPELPPEAHWKLGKLTMISMANENEGRKVSFSEMLRNHGLKDALENSPRGFSGNDSLEELIMEMIDGGFFRAVIDEENESVLFIESLIIRDCVPEEYPFRVLTPDSIPNRLLSRSRRYLTAWRNRIEV